MFRSPTEQQNYVCMMDSVAQMDILVTFLHTHCSERQSLTCHPHPCWVEMLRTAYKNSNTEYLLVIYRNLLE